MTQEEPKEDKAFDSIEQLSKIAQDLVRRKTELAQRTWVGLNKEEAFELQVKHKGNPFSLSAAVENLLREKNK